MALGDLGDPTIHDLRHIVRVMQLRLDELRNMPIRNIVHLAELRGEIDEVSGVLARAQESLDAAIKKVTN